MKLNDVKGIEIQLFTDRSTRDTIFLFSPFVSVGTSEGIKLPGKSRESSR